MTGVSGVGTMAVNFCLKFGMQLPRLGKGGNGMRAFDDPGFGPFFSAADINHHNAVFCAACKSAAVASPSFGGMATATSSTSKTNVAFGGITPPAPAAP